MQAKILHVNVVSLMQVRTKRTLINHDPIARFTKKRARNCQCLFYTVGTLQDYNILDYFSDLSNVLKYISFMAVDVNCMVNELETAVRTAPAHRSFSGIIVNTRVFDDVCAALLCSF